MMARRVRTGRNSSENVEMGTIAPQARVRRLIGDRTRPLSYKKSHAVSKDWMQEGKGIDNFHALR